MIVSIIFLSLACMIITKKTVDNFASVNREVYQLKERMEQIERAVVRDECLRNEYNFTTRRPTVVDME